MDGFGGEVWQTPKSLDTLDKLKCVVRQLVLEALLYILGIHGWYRTLGTRQNIGTDLENAYMAFDS